jgi:hypothetical protein
VHHPIVAFAREPESIDNILALDDTVILGALGMLAEGRDTVVSSLASRLRDRQFYKAIDVRKSVREKLAADAHDESNELDAIVDRVCANVGVEISRLRDRSDPDELPTVLWDEAEREPYNQLEESKGPLNQITVKTQEGDLVDLRRLSATVRAVKTFRLNRAYVPEKGGESATLVERLVDEGVRNVAHH